MWKGGAPTVKSTPAKLGFIRFKADRESGGCSKSCPLCTIMYLVQRLTVGPHAVRPGLADLSDELLAVVISKMDNLTQKIGLSSVCRRFHGLLFHPKALGDVTLSIDILEKQGCDSRSMEAVRCFCRQNSVSC